ncbi:MAG: Ppx/GppA family phosphatase [Actinomycetota bacterium]|nr:Ppx/GppA family phosphatase [Actinomycetota bacterium]
MGGGQRIAVADLGTNSTRLLVADATPDGMLVEVERLSEVTRLGQGVDSSGRLAEEAIERVHRCLARYRKVADGHRPNRTIAVATSAVRDAANGPQFQEAVRERSGFELRIIPGEEEARLTFLGATAGRAAGSESVLVIDIGGGSTEYVVGHPGADPDFHVSTRLGSVRQTERHLTADPPPHEDLEALAAAAREILVAAVPVQVRERVEAGIAVAGTATSLAAIDQELAPYDAVRVDGYRLMLAECERMLARLAAMPLDQRREVAGLHPDRAPTIVAGATILVESMRAFGLEHVEVGEADILHGVALDLLTRSPWPSRSSGPPALDKN